MKFKFSPAYIYLGIIILAAVVIIVFTQTEKPAALPLPADGQTTMPDDDIHKGIPKDGAPGSANVQKEVVMTIDSLKNYVSKNQSDTASMRKYADMLFAAHKPAEAQQYYEMILKKDPKRIDMMFALSNVYYFNQEFKMTEEMTNRILKIDPNNLEAKFNLGAVAATMGNDAKAKEIWQSIISKSPDHPMAEMSRQALARLK